MRDPNLKTHLAVLSALLLAAWLSSSWWIADSSQYSRTQALIRQEMATLAQQADDAAGDIRRNVAHWYGIPYLIAQDARTSAGLRRLGANDAARPASVEQKKAVWLADPVLATLDGYLEQTAEPSGVNLLWVMNASGVCIAASNVRQPDSLVGTNYADQDYFKSALSGALGHQFVVDRHTNAPGLVLSAPVRVEGRIIGVIATEIKLAEVTHWVHGADAFITDDHGVVILAWDRAEELHSLPMASVTDLSASERLARYQRVEFPPLGLNTWGDARFPDLQRLPPEREPILMATRRIAGLDIDVHVFRRLPFVAEYNAGRLERFLLLATSGGLVLLLATAGGVFAIEHRQAAKREAQQQIQTLAFYDSLTKLPNRRLLLNRLGVALAGSARSHRHGALLFVDVDRFNTVNDTAGHTTGDLLLTEVAHRLRADMRETDTVARLGGDEFAILLEDLSPDAITAGTDAADVAEKIRLALGRPYTLECADGPEPHSFSVTTSIGICLFQGQDVNVSELVKRVDVAMHEAQAAGGNTVRHFSPDMNAALQARRALESELRLAVEHTELQLYLQAQVDRARRIIGAECLVMWNHPRRGLVSPDEFIPLAEETGLIMPLGRWVLEAACLQLKEWATHPTRRALRLAVNISARQFRQKDFIEQVREVLARSGADPACLKLGLTERVVLDDIDATIEKMRALRVSGLGFSMDDFGAGDSSLACLRRFPVDQLKIDQSFIRNVGADPHGPAIAAAIVTMGRALGMTVIAKGVDTEQQHEFLYRQGCDAFQGYLFGRPVPVVEFERQLEGRLSSRARA